MSTADPSIKQMRMVNPQQIIFYANCTIGLENKKKMLQKTGNWLL